TIKEPTGQSRPYASPVPPGARLTTCLRRSGSPSLTVSERRPFFGSEVRHSPSLGPGMIPETELPSSWGPMRRSAHASGPAKTTFRYAANSGTRTAENGRPREARISRGLDPQPIGAAGLKRAFPLSFVTDLDLAPGGALGRHGAAGLDAHFCIVGAI